MSNRTPVPDALFDADLCQPLGREDWVDRFKWVIDDGLVVHAPVTWTWTCPACGESGVMPDGPDLLADLHGSQHAEGPFGAIVPLEIEAVRAFAE
ncbi:MULTISPECIES: hypothetical protein [Paenarthrobacter]|uniref:Uncharacterized protein n=1 Tax=Paenarthrobacter ureafaciens TaxID=37931 RepID=A0AAX3ED58_PAEUR|nr:MULTISPECIES: hypothetical protein [Paenarthrobacter]NKR13325.1 hypothetical protein [Arthrobacter sp. M5]NKR14825.1 hypothetical protein [Arthrobacter sp. M6]OEH62378.1 hypothetical protein A5N13_01595 [Arthrobacter sp. D4]OEH62949.1 hypothetical protein A5N17_09835 [Arthrobacter sp. D2]MDO5865123.1 hypothetical protein [Paenarthrobacter sp. SD-2]